MSWREHTYQPGWKRVQPRHLAFAGGLLASLWLLYYTFSPTKRALEIVIPGDIFSGEKFEEVKVPGDVWLDRANAVRDGFRHVYHGYEEYAFPKDELKPVGKKGRDIWNGWGVTAYDSLDTMLLMGLDAEFERAIKVVEKTDFSKVKTHDGLIPFFETVIRYLGGMLSAHALSKRAILLTKADELATTIGPIFNSKSALPAFGYFPKNDTMVGLEDGLLAEISTMQMEYLYLAKLTGKKEHYDRAHKVNSILERANVESTGGMLPIVWNITTGLPITRSVSVGSAADSAHEYLLKQYLMTSKTNKKNLEMYLRMTTHVLTHLLYITPTRRLLYVTDTTRTGRPTHLFEHLSCFFPGLLALGAHTLPLDNLTSLGIDISFIHSELGAVASDAYGDIKDFSLKELHMWAAEGLAETCYTTYADMPTGLGPEEMIMKTSRSGAEKWITALGKWDKRGLPPGVSGGLPVPVVYSEKESQMGTGKGRDYAIRKYEYLLRPETIESLHIMWKVTGDVKWRERGWEIFKAIEKHCKTSSGYSSIKWVDQRRPTLKDDLPSYFFAETLKYLFLLFSDSDPISLEKWVFNTEAHPFPVFEWTEKDKHAFGGALGMGLL